MELEFLKIFNTLRPFRGNIIFASIGVCPFEKIGFKIEKNVILTPNHKKFQIWFATK